MEDMDDNAAEEVFVDDSRSTAGYHSLGIDVGFPGGAAVRTLISSRDTSMYENIELDVYLPEDAPGDVSCLLFLQDGEWLWYQTREHSLSRGEWQTISASIAPESLDWKAVGHSQPWNVMSRMNLNVIGVKLVSQEQYAGRFNIDNVSFGRVLFPDHTKNVSRLSVGEKLELTFDLPATYTNPFDPEQIDVEGIFTAPSGEKIAVPGFFYQEYERRMVTDEEGRRLEALDPKGAPCWKIRFTPMEAGTYSYEITVADRGGERSTGSYQFEVERGETPAFVRTDPGGGKGFVLENGDYFYPIGFNYRSPYDVRYEQNILGRRITEPREASSSSNVALDDGTFGFEEYMAEMAGYGMNFIETWMAPWWLALEWSPQRIGFRGAGRYNMRNAWKFDRVMDAAAAHDIHVMLVIINHGQLSTWVDEEWQDHPYNVEQGGFLESPEEVFSDPRARRLIKNKLRYIVARWGYSPNIFAWNLLNEMNLVGSQSGFWRSDEIVEWFDEMATYLKEIDPWEHMVTGHFTGNFNSDIFRLDNVDFTANNAYYNVRDQNLVRRLQGAYHFHRRFEKPFVIAEFGGTAGGGTVRNLRRDLRVGLWAGYTMPIAASPLFWWNQLVRDQEWYHIYHSLVQFEQIVGGARRGMDTLHPRRWELTAAPPQNGDDQETDSGENDAVRAGNEDGHGADGLMMHCPEKDAYIGWFYNTQYLQDLQESVVLEQIPLLELEFQRINEGDYRFVLWDTENGKALEETEIALEPGIAIPLQPFTKDIAIYLRRLQ